MRALLRRAVSTGLLAACACMVLAAGCAARKPNLLKLYQDAAPPPRPVILIPGAFGSKLKDPETGELVWGDAPSLFRNPFKPGEPEVELLDLPIGAAPITLNRDRLIPAGIFQEVAGRSLYGRIWHTLDEAGGYTPGEIRDPRPGEDLFTFDYDWRRDVAESAGRLDEAVRRVLEARGEPDGKVDLVAHSLGGLVARYYVLHGGRPLEEVEGRAPSHDGGRRVRQLVFVGTPNAGTMDAFSSLLHGVKLVRRIPAPVIFSMPSAYALLPHPSERVLIDGEGEPLPDDIFDPATWEKYRWSVFDPEIRREVCRERAKAGVPGRGDAGCPEMEKAWREFASRALARARRLIESIRGPDAAGGPVRYSAFGGDCEPTPARAVIVEEAGGYATYTRPEDLPRRLRKKGLEDRMTEPGDGSVTRASLLGGRSLPGLAGGPPDLVYTGFFCENHRLLTEEYTFQDNLLHLLLERP